MKISTISKIIFLIALIVFIYSSGASQTNDAGLTITIKDGNRKENIKLYEDSYALIIGVSNYTSGWPILPGVKKDIEAVKNLLEKQGFKITLIEDPDSQKLRDGFSDFINNYGLTRNNRLIFYFAGHGHTLKQAYGEEMGYIVPTDAPNPNMDLNGFLKKALDMQQLEVYAKRIQSKHALFLFDSCFSGSIFNMTRAIPEFISYKTEKDVRQFITSGSADEKVPDISLFRDQLISALEGEGDADKDGYITGTELGEFLQKNVVNYSKGNQHPQYGKIRNPNLDKGDFVFEVIKPNKTENKTNSLIKAEPEKLQTPDSSELEEILKKAEKKEKLVETAKAEFEKVKTIDEKESISNEDKIKAWDFYLNNYKSSDYQIAYAEERKKYWNNPISNTPTPESLNMVLNTESEMQLYILTYLTSKLIKNRAGIEFNNEALIEGYLDVLNNKPLKYEEKDMPIDLGIEEAIKSNRKINLSKNNIDKLSYISGSLFAYDSKIKKNIKESDIIILKQAIYDGINDIPPRIKDDKMLEFYKKMEYEITINLDKK